MKRASIQDTYQIGKQMLHFEFENLGFVLMVRLRPASPQWWRCSDYWGLMLNSFNGFGVISGETHRSWRFWFVTFEVAKKFIMSDKAFRFLQMSPKLQRDLNRRIGDTFPWWAVLRRSRSQPCQTSTAIIVSQDSMQSSSDERAITYSRPLS